MCCPPRLGDAWMEDVVDNTSGRGREGTRSTFYMHWPRNEHIDIAQVFMDIGLSDAVQLVHEAPESSQDAKQCLILAFFHSRYSRCLSSLRYSPFLLLHARTFLHADSLPPRVPPFFFFVAHRLHTFRPLSSFFFSSSLLQPVLLLLVRTVLPLPREELLVDL